MWPTQFQQLIPLVHELILTQGTGTGLPMLKLMMEEFVTTKADMPSVRK